LIGIWFDNPTRSVGQVGFVAAALAAALAARRGIRPDLRLWWTVASVFSLLWIETALGWRFVPRTVAHELLDMRARMARGRDADGHPGGARRRGGGDRRCRGTCRAAPAIRCSSATLSALDRRRLFGHVGAGGAVRRGSGLAARHRRLAVRERPLLVVGWLWLAASAVVVVMAAAHSRGR
jgi:hypothetical protein